MMILHMVAPSLVLLTSMVEDIKYKKVHNRTILIMAGLAVCLSFFQVIQISWLESLLGVATAFFLFLPLYWVKGVGAGDVKVAMVLGIFIGSSQILNVFLFSLICGLSFGLLMILLKGRGTLFLKNMASILTLKKREDMALQSMPYTVALFSGWICNITYMHYGRLL